MRIRRGKNVVGRIIRTFLILIYIFFTEIRKVCKKSAVKLICSLRVMNKFLDCKISYHNTVNIWE